MQGKRLAWLMGGATVLLISMIGAATKNFGLMCLPVPVLLIVYWIAR